MTENDFKSIFLTLPPPIAMPSSIEERNDYSVRRLQILDQTLAAKVKKMYFLNPVPVYIYCSYTG